MQIIYVDNLLHFYEVGHISMLINASLEVPCASKPARSARNKQECAVFCITSEIKLAYVSINDGHDPLLLDEASVELFYQVMVPQKMRLEGRVLTQDLLREAVNLQALQYRCATGATELAEPIVTLGLLNLLLDRVALNLAVVLDLEDVVEVGPVVLSVVYVLIGLRALLLHIVKDNLRHAVVVACRRLALLLLLLFHLS